MVLVQLRTYFIPYFVLVNGSCGKKEKGTYLQKNETSRQTWGGGGDLKSGKEAACPTVFPCTDIFMQQLLFLAFFSATQSNQDIPWFIWRENWIKNGKEADMWGWQLVLTPTHWESKEVYCFSWYLVFGDILFVAVIFKAIQLLYFERWVWEKPFFSFGTSPRLNLPVTATVLCQSFSGAHLQMKSQETCPISSGTGNHSHASSTVLLSLHTSVFVFENHNGKTHFELRRRQCCKCV